MRNCETCIYWGTGNDADNQLRGKLKPCEKMRMFYDCTEWSDDDEDIDSYSQRELKEKYKDNKAFVQDGSDYKATLYVLASFGCVEHESK